MLFRLVTLYCASRKGLVNEVKDPHKDINMILSTMIALIICEYITDVTILPTSSITNEIAKA